MEITEEVNTKSEAGRSKREVAREFGFNECTLRKQLKAVDISQSENLSKWAYGHLSKWASFKVDISQNGHLSKWASSRWTSPKWASSWVESPSNGHFLQGENLKMGILAVDI
ncbi:hypothetical protein AVEN_181281-1 [Araneus ventricosus]|uniref:Uncharacterized protein n=1 Tax=Araneus ventricosus TaxID=182803 RepID=A0A4Y2RLV8_ARAVE|nr:hypothetical protein AVEN_181281-1 [Araneus ventricosus]